MGTLPCEADRRYVIMLIANVDWRVTRHFLNSHFRVRFLIGCSDKLADVDIRLRVIWAIGLGPGSDCSVSDMAPIGDMN